MSCVHAGSLLISALLALWILVRVLTMAVVALDARGGHLAACGTTRRPSAGGRLARGCRALPRWSKNWACTLRLTALGRTVDLHGAPRAAGTHGCARSRRCARRSMRAKAPTDARVVRALLRGRETADREKPTAESTTTLIPSCACSSACSGSAVGDVAHHGRPGAQVPHGGGRPSIPGAPGAGGAKHKAPPAAPSTPPRPPGGGYAHVTAARTVRPGPGPLAQE